MGACKTKSNSKNRAKSSSSHVCNGVTGSVRVGFSFGSVRIRFGSVWARFDSIRFGLGSVRLEIILRMFINFYRFL